MFLSKNPENVLENRETSLPISRCLRKLFFGYFGRCYNSKTWHKNSKITSKRDKQTQSSEDNILRHLEIGKGVQLFILSDS
jgi:hypothetical protein